MNKEPNNSQPRQENGKPRGHGFRRRKAARQTPLQNTSAQPQVQKPRIEHPKRESKVCKVCGKPIFDLAGALAAREDGEPIHFDCAIEILAKEEKLAEDEKLIYIGSGQFGVVFNAPGGKFEIRRKIKWETAGSSLPWRKPMISAPNLP